MAQNNKKYKISFLSFGIIENKYDPLMPYCLMCKKLANSFYRELKIKEHFELKHYNLKGRDSAYFLKLKENYKPLNLVKKAKNQGDGEFYKELSIETVFIIAKQGKPYILPVKLISPLISKVLNFHKINETNYHRHFSVSAAGIKRNIDKIAFQIESSLVSVLQKK